MLKHACDFAVRSYEGRNFAKTGELFVFFHENEPRPVRTCSITSEQQGGCQIDTFVAEDFKNMMIKTACA